MNRLDRFKQQIQLLAFGSILGCGALVAFSYVLSIMLPTVPAWIILVGCLVVTALLAWFTAAWLTRRVIEPLSFLWQAILHVAPEHSTVPAPNIDEATMAHELVTSLVLQVYQLASNTSATPQAGALTAANPILDDVARNLPVPVIAVSKDQTVKFANSAALQYLQKEAANVIGQNLYSLMDLSFSEEQTLDRWLQDCRQNKATDRESWQRVRLRLPDGETVKQFDLAAAYSKEDPAGVEVLLAIFDQSNAYKQDDNDLDFVALTVHELRTPLTSLRGYIEVFQDELNGKLSPELNDFMQKMEASAQQLTAFVSNILNVARIQEGLLSLHLQEEDWPSIITAGVESMDLTAQLHGIQLRVAPMTKLPNVAVDKISIAEVLNNLLENAIKYSNSGGIVTVEAHLTTENLIETTVTDTGVGIPSSVMPTLFQKFHRNHRNQAKIGGSGLGLYLCSALVKAHGGNIWIKSKEGQGTTVGFTIQPYSALAGKLKDSNNTDIVRNAHGWIKNHSLYRR